MLKQPTLQNQLFFYGLFAAVAILALMLVFPFFDTIAFSLVMVIILKPVYDFFMRRLNNRSGLATLLTFVVFFAAAIIPGWLIVSVVINQITAFTGSIDPATVSGATVLENFSNRANVLLQQVPFAQNYQIGPEEQQKLADLAKSAGLWLVGTGANLGMSIPALIARTFIFLGIVGVLLPNYHSFVQRLMLLSPLDDEIDAYYLRKIKKMVWAMFTGLFVIAVAQGLVTGLFFVVAGVPFAPMWTVLAVVASMLPLGASMIAIPIGAVQLITGNTTSGLIILLGYFLIVSNVDTVLRPRLVSKEAYLNFALILLAALGGYLWFGFFGVIYGPVLMVLLTTTVDVYEKYYVRREKAPEPRAGEAMPSAAEAAHSKSSEEAGAPASSISI